MVVDLSRVLNLSEANCSLPHVLARHILPQFRHNLPAHNFSFILVTSHQKNLNSSTQPEGLMQYFQVAGAKTGSYRWAFHVGANSNREKHKRVATKKYHAIAITSCLNPLTFSLTLHINSNEGN